VIENMQFHTTDKDITYYKELEKLGPVYRHELKYQTLYNSLAEYDKQNNTNGKITLDEFKEIFRAARKREASCRHDPRIGTFPYEHERPSVPDEHEHPSVPDEHERPSIPDEHERLIIQPNMWHVAWRMSYGFFKHHKLLYTHEEPAEFKYTGEPIWEDVAASAPGKPPPQTHGEDVAESAPSEPPQTHARSQKERATASDKPDAGPPGPPRTGGKIKRVLDGHTSSEDEESSRPHDAGSSSTKYQKSEETGNYLSVSKKTLHPREPPSKATIPYPQSKPTTKADGRRKPPPPVRPEVVLITDSDEEQGKADEMETDDNPPPPVRPEVVLITDSDEEQGKADEMETDDKSPPPVRPEVTHNTLIADSEEKAAGSRAPPTEEAAAAAKRRAWLAAMSGGRLSYVDRAPHAPQDAGKSRAPPHRPASPPSVEEWLAKLNAEKAAEEAAQRERLAKNSNGRLSYRKADISEMLRQLKIYCS
jgi:hypothetical protein